MTSSHKEYSFGICAINSHLKNDTFVGVRAKDGKIMLCFPLGFDYENSDEKLVKKDIMLLLKTVKHTNTKVKSELLSQKSFLTQKDNFPITAYESIIKDYISYGYYKETELTSKINGNGKINYSRTIKTQKPLLQDDKAFYLKFITRHNTTKQDELITQIHKYFVYESFKMLGWLFMPNFTPQKPSIRYDKNLFKSMVKSKLSTTFNDRKRELFRNFLLIIEQENSGDYKNFEYGTERFEYAWELMIDEVFGIKNKDKYNPSSVWVLKDGSQNTNSPLRPDTIMQNDDKIYILDAKYYKFGITNNPSDLPNTSDVAKQIIYGEYATSLHKTDKIYNTFIMPFNAREYGVAENIVKIGEALAKWKDNANKYEKIQGILVDTKFLMALRFKFNKIEVQKLSKIISS